MAGVCGELAQEQRSRLSFRILEGEHDAYMRQSFRDALQLPSTVNIAGRVVQGAQTESAS